MKLTNILSFLSIVLMFGATSSFATNYYVNGNDGSNTASGTTVATAYKTLQKAADVSQAGDTIFVMNGTYINTSPNTSVLQHKRSGTAAKPIVYKNYQNHKPLISFTGWHGVKIEGSYVIFDGLTVRGGNANIKLSDALNQPESCNVPSGTVNSKFNGNGFFTDGKNSPKVHHITIRNCTVYECPGSGIQTVQSDYITIENNLVYNNAWYSIYAPSGISLYQMWNFDTQTGVKNIIRNNICYGNRMFVPWPAVNCTFTDGNGIIIDDSKNTQAGSTQGLYKGRTLVINNVCYKNGGSGIHSFLSEHVDIINNTAFQNSQTPSINNGEIYPSKSGDVRIFNNILWSQSSKKLNTNFQNATDNLYDYNLHFGGIFPTLTGTNTLKGDPIFQDTAKANFQLKTNSPAINKGIDILSGTNAPTTDILGNKRPFGTKIDMGAYEFGYSTSANDTETELTSVVVSPNPIHDLINISFENTQNTPIRVLVVNTNGGVVSYTTFEQLQQGKIALQVPVSDLSAGIYFVRIIQNGLSKTEKVVKL
jgi:parallel beta-helix repeat protein